MGQWLPNLQQLDLSDNQFLSGTIPSSITNASLLIFLDLSNNSFSGYIPDAIGDLEQLQYLILEANNLTTRSSTQELSFFNSLTNCRNLIALGVSQNPLAGFLPDSVENLSANLKVFRAQDCEIRGKIPNKFGNLSSLETLFLSTNKLTGSLPKTLWNLENLEILSTVQNFLEGSVPCDICLLKRLGEVYFSENQLSGSIPACLGEMDSLTKLFLDSNKLTSSIPPMLCRRKNLLDLNLSSNLLTGTLPSDFLSLSELALIDLSRNQLSGGIPTSIEALQMLNSLSLAHNKLQGSIPQSLGKLISLVSLDLSDNNLSGAIPTSLGELKYLQFLNLSSNKLQGEIPTNGQFANFTAQSFMQNDALCGAPRLLVPRCKIKELPSKASIFLKYILPVISSAIVLISIIFLWRRTKWYQIQDDSKPFEWARISYYELLNATEAFNETNLIGSGGFGSVFKGTLSNGNLIAVKVFNMQSEASIKSFNIECEVLSQIRHRNLVRIISSCTNLDFKSIVMEYMPRGNLDKWLYSRNYFLDIVQRLNVMIDIASAVEYLHHGQTTPIVHLDLKPSNVLLDDDLNARVSDFGLAKVFGHDEFMTRTATFATIGYMAPEYGSEGIVSTKSDVYSFGIVLMETFTRKKPTDEMFSGEMNLRSWVREESESSIFEIVDSNLIGPEDELLSAKEQCLKSVFDLAMDCTIDSPVDRTDMEDVLVRLRKIKENFVASAEDTEE